jgi:hypothetical protein
VSPSGRTGFFAAEFSLGCDMTDTAREVSYDDGADEKPGRSVATRSGAGMDRVSITTNNPQGAYRFRPDGKRFRLRAVVGRLATLKVDRASIAEARFSLAA